MRLSVHWISKGRYVSIGFWVLDSALVLSHRRKRDAKDRLPSHSPGDTKDSLDDGRLPGEDFDDDPPTAGRHGNPNVAVPGVDEGGAQRVVERPRTHLPREYEKAPERGMLTSPEDAKAVESVDFGRK